MSDKVDDFSPDLQKSGPLTKPLDFMSDTRVLLAWHRSHLANERTFLAWGRTSIALLAFGFLIEKFDIFIRSLIALDSKRLDPKASPEILFLSIGSFVVAGLIILLAGIRFSQVRRHINLGEPSFSIVPDLLVVTSFFAIALMSVVLIIRGIPYINALF